MMMRRSLVAVTVLLALFAVPSAAGEEVDGYTATSTPSHVRPSIATPFQIQLSNKANSPRAADRARIGIPAGFVVAAGTVEATTTAAPPSCDASSWIADGTLIADGKINLKRPGGSAKSLCPGATLTVAFSATASGPDRTDQWETELFGDVDTFTLTGPQPTVAVDGTPPIVAIDSRPSDPSSDTSPTFSYSAGESATFECRLDNGGFEQCTSPTTYAVSDGEHTFAVRATDLAGNVGSAETYSWLVETVKPVVELTSLPKPLSNSATASFVFTSSRPASFECKLDGGPYGACSSPQTYTGLAEGAHTFVVRATGTGGTGPETAYSWTIDTVAPGAAISARPADPTNNRAATFEFAASEPASFQCRLDDGAFALCASPQSYSNLGDGRHTFVVRATDAASNAGDAAYTWTIETRPPALALTFAPPGLTNSATAQFSFAADEPASFHCNVDDRGFEPCGSPASYAGLRDGGHAFAVRAVDAAGNIAAASHAWTVDATAPQTSVSSRPPVRATARTARFAFSANEPGTFECRLDSGPFLRCTSPRTYPRLRVGVHRFEVRAVDAAGNPDATPATSRWTISGATRRAAAAAALFAPTDRSRVTRPPMLRWRGVSGATYYNVQLYRGGRKVLSAWPTRTRLQLRSRWRFTGRVERLKPGTYRWYAWPGYGRAADRRYGRLLGASSFVVVAGTSQRR